jgi:imidazolonepropionase-like amidohydrolase
MNNFLKASILVAAFAGQTEAKTLLFKNGVIHTVSGATIEKGQVLVTDGKITSVANAEQNLSADETIDLAGQHLYPGFINPIGSLGLIEVDAIRATRDLEEVGAYTPEVQAWKAVNPDSELIPIGRANGITHTIVVPYGGIVSGQSGLVQLGAGWTMEDLAVKTPIAMHLFWPSMTLNTTPRELARDKENWKSLEEQAKERRLKIKQIEDFFAEAEAYAANRPTEAARNPSWEAMIPLVKNEIPLVVQADSVREIKAAMEFAARHKYRMILSGGRDAWRLAKELAAAKIPVVFERIYNDGDGLAATNARDTEPYDVHFRAPAVLAEAGVKFAITGGLGGEEATNVRNNPYYAAQAVAFGLSREEAIKALTLYPAEMFGVADRLGSIAEGKEASLFVATGDMLDIRTQVKRVWIRGEETSLQNKQTRLYEKYRARPRK